MSIYGSGHGPSAVVNRAMRNFFHGVFGFEDIKAGKLLIIIYELEFFLLLPDL